MLHANSSYAKSESPKGRKVRIFMSLNSVPLQHLPRLLRLLSVARRLSNISQPNITPRAFVSTLVCHIASRACAIRLWRTIRLRRHICRSSIWRYLIRHRSAKGDSSFTVSLRLSPDPKFLREHANCKDEEDYNDKWHVEDIPAGCKSEAKSEGGVDYS